MNSIDTNLAVQPEMIVVLIVWLIGSCVIINAKPLTICTVLCFVLAKAKSGFGLNFILIVEHPRYNYIQFKLSRI